MLLEVNSSVLISGVYCGEQRQSFCLIFGNPVSRLLLCCLLLHLGGKHEELKDVLVLLDVTGAEAQGALEAAGSSW